MPLDKIFESNVLNFVMVNRDRSAFNSDHWTFIHIPKTAGSSFREEIANVRQPAYNLEVDYAALDSGSAGEQFEERKSRALQEYALKYFAKTRFVSGHFTYRDIAKFVHFQESKLIVMLRNPLDRLRSDFLHQTSKAHPLWESAMQRYPTFRHFVEDPANHNVMFKYLCKDEEDSVETTLNFLKMRYTWIGTQESYNFSIKMLFMLFGMRIEPKIRLREGRSAPNELVQLTKDGERAVYECNRTDIEIHQYFHEYYNTVKKDFFALSDFDRLYKRIGGLPS